jgi:hypothetical protein
MKVMLFQGRKEMMGDIMRLTRPGRISDGKQAHDQELSGVCGVPHGSLSYYRPR